MTTSFSSVTTALARHTGQRSEVGYSTCVAISNRWQNTHCRSRLSSGAPGFRPDGLGDPRTGRANVPGPPGGRIAGGLIHGQERLRRDIRAVDAGPGRLLGRSRGGHPLGPALGPSLRRLAPAVLSLV